MTRRESKITISGDIAEVELTRGFVSIIDVDDIPLIKGRAWSVLINSQTGHAYAVCARNGKAVLMHRVLLDAPADKTVDHEDGDGLNNRRINIRIATPSQNMANKAVERRNKLGIKGVHAERGKFVASIKPAGKTIHLGRFDTKEEAAAAYRGAAKVIWGEYAKK